MESVLPFLYMLINNNRRSWFLIFSVYTFTILECVLLLAQYNVHSVRHEVCFTFSFKHSTLIVFPRVIPPQRHVVVKWLLRLLQILWMNRIDEEEEKSFRNSIRD